MTAEYKKDFLLNVLFIGAVIGLVLLASRFLLFYLFPFVIGVIVALLAQKPAQKISDKINIKKQSCAVVLTIIFCFLFFALIFLISWALWGKISDLLRLMPKYFSDVQSSFEKFRNGIIKNMPSLSLSQKDAVNDIFSDTVSSVLSSATRFLSSLATGLIKGLPAFLISSLVTVVASCYIAKDFDKLKKFVLGLMSNERAGKIAQIKSILGENTAKFIKGYALITLITFFELTLAFIILGVNSPLILAFIVAFVDLLPVLGVGTVLVPWSVVEFLGQNYFLGAGLLISYAIIAIVRNFIEPKIIGEQIGINPIFTLVSMFLGLKTAGIIGMILCPLALTVVVGYYKKTEI